MSYHGPMDLIANPARMGELRAMPRCSVCLSLVKVCGGCKETIISELLAMGPEDLDPSAPFFHDKEDA